MMKNQVDTRKDVQSFEWKKISEEYVLKPRLRAKANECVPNVVDYNKVITESKKKKENNWIMPKQMPIGYFYKKYSNAEKKKERRNISRYEVLNDNDDDEKCQDKKELETKISKIIQENKRKKSMKIN